MSDLFNLVEISRNHRDPDGNIPTEYKHCDFCKDYHSHLIELYFYEKWKVVICSSCLHKMIGKINEAILNDCKGNNNE